MGRSQLSGSVRDDGANMPDPPAVIPFIITARTLASTAVLTRL
jgi:hypothetical protein